MQLNSILLLILLSLVCLVLPAQTDDKETARRGEESFEDEILSKTDERIEFGSIMNDISQKKEEKPTTQGKCGARLKVPKMLQLGIPSIGGEPAHADIDPQLFANVLFNVMGLLELKVKEAINISDMGVCLQIKPIDIFLIQHPYTNYGEIISKNVGLDALNKMKQLKAEVKLKIRGV
ncbi:uncharacterized protein LOC129568432 [Sitodiplosis mosellana]|uniref:uncharacterized protein LOC129568432 n=1 Tax=Sitodiplosis mosellana TaxID=263140 RepID=UPI002443C643|nr:uncharacterized protein LOC129568432 [Sitodiplosis mosellana]